MKPIDTPDVVYISTYGSYEPWTERKEDEYDVCYIKADTLINKIELKLKSLQEVEHLASLDIKKAIEETLEIIKDMIKKGEC